MALAHDYVVACACGVSWYMSLLQYRGARWFQGLVQLAGAERGKKNNKCHLPSPSKALDTIQGPLGPVLTLVLWMLLVLKQLSRTWFYTVVMIPTFCFSIRAFVAIVTKRAATIKRISVMQNQAPGSIADKTRRMRTLKRKTNGVVFDLFVIFVSYVSLTGSSFMTGAFFSSRRAILNYAVGESVAVVLVIGVSFGMHSKVYKVKKKQRRVQEMQTQKSKTRINELGDTIESQLSGLSMVEQSCFTGGGGAGARGNQSGEALFSEVQTDA
jgi:hypothetical protein